MLQRHLYADFGFAIDAALRQLRHAGTYGYHGTRRGAMPLYRFTLATIDADADAAAASYAAEALRRQHTVA